MACGQIVNCLVENVLSLEEKAVGKISHSQLSSTAKLQCDLVQIYILSYFELVLKHFRVTPIMLVAVDIVGSIPCYVLDE